MMLRSLIPVVTDCLVSVAHSYKEGVGHDATTMNTKLAQALFRKNPAYAPKSLMQKTITRLINEEIVSHQVRQKQAKYKKVSPIIYELFHNYDADGDSYITLDEVKSLLHDVGSVLSFSVLEAHDLIAMLDFHGTGRVDFHDFEKGMKRLFQEEQLKSALDLLKHENNDPHGVHIRMMSHRDQFLLEHAEMKLLQMLEKKDYNFQKLFNELDRNQDDSISLTELASALRGLSTELGIQSKAKTLRMSSETAFTEQTIALLLSKERLDIDGDHCVDYLEFQQFCKGMLKHHGIALARRASVDATHLARITVWEAARGSLQRIKTSYDSMERMFSDTNERAKGIHPQEKTISQVILHRQTARAVLDDVCALLEQGLLLVAEGYDDKTYQNLLTLAARSNEACRKGKTAVHEYSKVVMTALQLHERLLEANRNARFSYDRFSVLKAQAQELQGRWKKANTDYTNQHTKQTMNSLHERLLASVQMRREMPSHLTSQADLETMNIFVLGLDNLDRSLRSAADEMDDADILEQADIALDASVCSGSLYAVGRSLVAAVCKSAAPLHILVAVFLQTSENEAMCVAASGEEKEEEEEGGANKKSADSKTLVSTRRVVPGTTSVPGDEFGFDCLRRGARHKANHYAQPLTKKDAMHFAYLYMEKDNNKALEPRVMRFIQTLTEMASSRLLMLEKIDRLVRLAKAACSTLDKVAKASTFVGLRIGDTGIRFLHGSKKFEDMVKNISFIKASDARTLMAASESSVEPRTARCKGPCLAWRVGSVLFDISIVVGVADMNNQAHHSGIFLATQRVAKRCLLMVQESVSWHLGDQVGVLFKEEYKSEKL